MQVTGNCVEIVFREVQKFACVAYVHAIGLHWSSKLVNEEDLLFPTLTGHVDVGEVMVDAAIGQHLLTGQLNRRFDGRLCSKSLAQ